MTALRIAAPVLVVVLALCSMARDAAASDVGVCVETDPYGFCIEWDVSTPPTSGRPGGGGGQPACQWLTIDEDLSVDPTIWFDFEIPRPPEGVEIVWQSFECSDGSPGFDFRWLVPATPANLASVAHGRLVGQLPQPLVESSPPVGTASIVTVPVFVRVENWTGVVSESECAGGLCVTVAATPSLRFDPAEPGSGSVACAGAGSRYEPGGGSPEAQASAPGACAHAYQFRTGAEGRPAVWPAQVSVTWTLTWEASSGASGSLPSVTRSTDVPRPVSEVQTVVVGGATP